MIVQYTRAALADIAELRSFIAQDNPIAAQRVVQRIGDAIARLAEFPELGRRGRVAGTRELAIPRLPFVAAYRVSDPYVDVLAVRHGTQLWPSRFRER